MEGTRSCLSYRDDKKELNDPDRLVTGSDRFSLSSLSCFVLHGVSSLVAKILAFCLAITATEKKIKFLRREIVTIVVCRRRPAFPTP